METPTAKQHVDVAPTHCGGRPPHPILDIPLDRVLQRPFAMQLQHVLQLYTVGNLLGAWRHRECQAEIEGVFETPEQAHHAIATCAAWLGLRTVAAPGPVPPWWADEPLIDPA